MKFEPDTTLKDSYEKIFQNLKDSISDFDSYVLTDWGREIKFGIAGGSFYISGEPYYLFTYNDIEGVSSVYKLCDEIKDIPDDFEFKKDTLFKEIIDICSGEVYSWQYEKLLENITSIYSNKEYREVDYHNYLNEVKELVDNPSAMLSDDLQEVIEDSLYIELQKAIEKPYTKENALATEKIINELYYQNKIYYAWLYSLGLLEPDYKTYIDTIGSLLLTDSLDNHLLLNKDSSYVNIKELIKQPTLDNAIEIESNITELVETYYWSDTLSLLLEKLYSVNLYELNRYVNALQSTNLKSTPTAGIAALGEIMISLLYDPSTELSTKFRRQLTERIEMQANKLFEYNPAVYDACVKVMRYSAFFRYVKKNFPQSWNLFVDKINNAYPNSHKAQFAPKPSPSKGDDSPVNQGFITPNKIARSSS